MAEKRAPPGQILTKVYPVLSASDIPDIDLSTYRFRVFGEVENRLELSWEELMSRPRIRKIIDIDCVTHWSRIGDEWEGISMKALLDEARPRQGAKFVMEHSSYVGYTTNIPIAYAEKDDAVLAVNFNGRPLEPKHGGPIRAVIPGLYFWKSAKWIDGIELMNEDKPGFWEQRGYNMHGDPWNEERYSGPNISDILKRVLSVRQHKDEE